MTRKQWRCFFCDQVFSRAADAAEHFGCDDACEADVPACKIAAHEGHLVHYIRKLENELRRYVSEDSDVMRSIMTLEADHRQALIAAEEDGYNKGVRDMQHREFAGVTAPGEPGRAQTNGPLPTIPAPERAPGATLGDSAGTAAAR